MMYPYMTLPDETEITHSDIINNNGKEQVKVYIETPVEGGFKDFVEKAAHLFFKFARSKGFENAANF